MKRLLLFLVVILLGWNFVLAQEPVKLIKEGMGYRIWDIWCPQIEDYQQFYQNIRGDDFVSMEKIAADMSVPVTQLKSWAFENRKEWLRAGELTPLQALWRPVDGYGVHAVFYHQSQRVDESGYDFLTTPPVVPESDYKEFISVWERQNVPDNITSVYFGEVVKWMAFKTKSGLKVYPNCYLMYFQPSDSYPFPFLSQLPAREWPGTEFGIMANCGNTYRRYIKPPEKVIVPEEKEKPEVIIPPPPTPPEEEREEMPTGKPSEMGRVEVYGTIGQNDDNFGQKKDYYYGGHLRVPLAKNSNWWASVHGQYFKTLHYTWPWQQWRFDAGLLYWPRYSFMTEFNVGREYDDISHKWGVWSYTSVTGLSALKDNWAELILNYRAKPVDWTWWRFRDKHILFNLDGWALSPGYQHVWSGQIDWKNLGDTKYFQLNGLFLALEKWLNQPNEPNPKFGLFGGYNWGSSRRFDGWFVELYYKL